jgi:putative hydrolase
MYTDTPPVEADTHCHTVASTHAYSTVVEMAHYAALRGLRAIVITDHCSKLPDGAHPWHFGNLRCLPPYIEGVRVLHGAEANIDGYEGEIDLEPAYQRQLDWVIASYHDPVTPPGTVEQHTRSYLKLAENPYVDVIGHSGTAAFAYDYERVIPVFKEKGKIVEIDSHSFSARRGAKENCRTIALLCKRYGVPVVVSSDAHCCFDVGNVSEGYAMLEEIGFPKEQIVNLTLERLAAFISKKRNRKVL